MTPWVGSHEFIYDFTRSDPNKALNLPAGHEGRVQANGVHLEALLVTCLKCCEGRSRLQSEGRRVVN